MAKTEPQCYLCSLAYMDTFFSLPFEITLISNRLITWDGIYSSLVFTWTKPPLSI